MAWWNTANDQRMPADRNRITLSLNGRLASLLNYWATLEDRQVTDLTVRLLEDAVEAAIDNNRVPPIVMELVERELKQREAFLIPEHGRKIAALKENQSEMLDELNPYPGTEDETHFLTVKARGHYTDGLDIKEAKESKGAK